MATANDFGKYVPHTYGKELDAIYRSRLGWITGAVEASFPWPRKDVMVEYDGDRYFLRGMWEREKETAPCITMALDADEQQSVHAQMGKMYRFASILGWYLEGYADVVGHIHGSHPMLYGSVGKVAPNVSGHDHGFSCNYLPVITDPKTRLALAFWRDGERLFRIHPGFAFLAYYKVIESGFSEGRARGEWIKSNLAGSTGEALDRIKELQAEGAEVGEHLRDSCRHAIAHARLRVIDPDIPADRIRISKDLVIIRDLAYRYIHDDLGVPTQMDAYRFRDRLIPLYRYLSPDQIKVLRGGGSVIKRKLQINGLKVAVTVWPRRPAAPLDQLTLKVDAAADGLMRLVAVSDDETVKLPIEVDFRHRRVHANLYATRPPPASTPKHATAVLEYMIDTISNGVVEILLPSGEVLQCEAFIALNVDVGRTVENWRTQLSAIESIA